MSIAWPETPETKEKPLSREDIKSLPKEVGSTYRLQLVGRNLRGIDLTDFDLSGADLTGIDNYLLKDYTCPRARKINANFRSMRIGGFYLNA